MAVMSVAVQRRQWDLVAFCLALGVLKAAARIPPDALQGLLDALSYRADLRPPGGRREEQDGPQG